MLDFSEKLKIDWNFSNSYNYSTQLMHLNATETTQLNSKESYVLDSILLSGKLENLYLGSDSSDCPLPCTTFSTEVKISSEVDEYLGFGLNFLSTVQVTNALILFLESPPARSWG